MPNTRDSTLWNAVRQELRPWWNDSEDDELDEATHNVVRLFSQVGWRNDAGDELLWSPASNPVDNGWFPVYRLTHNASCAEP